MTSTTDDQPLFPGWNNQPAPPDGTFSQGDENGADLRRVLSVMRRRILLISGVGLAVSTGVIGQVLDQDPVYEGNFRLLVEPIRDKQKIDQINQTLMPGSASASLDYETQIQVLWSSQVLTPALEDIRTKYPEVSQGEISQKLKIARLKDTKILEVRYLDTDPHKIRFILDSLAANYIQYSKNEQQTSLRQGLEFVDVQLPELAGRVDRLQEKLQNFRQQYNLMEPESQGDILTTRVSNLVQQRQETETQLLEAQSLYGRLQSQLGLELEDAIAVTALSEAPRYQELLNQLQEVESQIAVETTRLKPGNPAIQALYDRRDNLLPLLNQEAATVLGGNSYTSADTQALASPNSIRLQITQKLIETINQYQILEARHWALTQAEQLMRQQVQRMAVIARQYTDLQRELQIATDSLNRFLSVQETLEIEAAQQAMPWQMILAPQTPTSPISPNLQRSLILGAIAGLLAGAAAAFLAEKLDNRFHSPQELQESTGLPLLVTIPFQKELKHNQINDSNASNSLAYGRYRVSAFLEAFRSLHANLYFLSPDKPLKSLAVSSSIPSEGKSTTAVYLAKAAAAMGRRVLLVDADLRRPEVHHIMDLTNAWGLSHVISSDSVQYQDVLQQIPGEENLYILTAGQTPPDPTRLLSSQKMRSLIDQFQQAFDLVIFDTPPLGGLADAKLLAAHTNGLMLVVGLGKTDRTAFKQVLEGLKLSHASVLGLCANGVKGYTPYSYGYYQGYYTSERQTEAEANVPQG